MSTSDASSGRPRKELPARPSQENLKKQAKTLAKARAIPLSKAQQELASDYGCKHWAALMQLVNDTLSKLQTNGVAAAGDPPLTLMAAARSKDIAQVRHLLASRTNSQADIDAGLAGALWYGDENRDWKTHQQIADLLIEHGANVNGMYGNYGPIVFGTGECVQPKALQYLIDHGCDVTFEPIDTKYGMQCPMSYWLGSYGRGNNHRKHQGIKILLEHDAYIPPEVTPAMLAIHMGDRAQLEAMLKEEPSLVHQHFPDMPYGNMSLQGATLLHLAAEFDEVDCCMALLDHGADINARAQLIDGIGGQTPLFHLVNTNWGSHWETLQKLIERAGSQIDLDITATWKTYDEPRTRPVAILEYLRESEGQNKHPYHDAQVMVLQNLNRPVIRDQHFKAAVHAIHTGDVAALKQLIDAHPNLLEDRVIEPDYLGQDYFRDPKLLWFIANNPNLIKTMPRNIVDITRVLLRDDTLQEDLDYTLGLVMTSLPAREQKLQRPLIMLLREHGAQVDAQSLYGTLGHQECDAVQALLDAGLPLSAEVAAGLGMAGELESLLSGISAYELHAAFSLAVINKHVTTATMCLDAGADVNENMVVHKNSCAAHQAAINDDVPMLKLLVERGANLQTKDSLWLGTPLGWAIHNHKPNAQAYLKSL